jgi:hypothetical protein
VTEAPEDNDFSDEFCGFLQTSVATVDAAELLLLLAQHRDRDWSVRELVAKVSGAGALADADADNYLDALAHRGLVERAANGRVRYRSSAADDSHVATLRKLYVERPVTLFRVIYALRDAKIKTLADAFQIFRK